MRPRLEEAILHCLVAFLYPCPHHRVERKRESKGTSMRKLCPNLDREDGLDTVLEVPLPEEMFLSGDSSKSSKTLCINLKAWMRPHADPSAPWPVGREAELQLLLGILGAPLVPFPVRSHKSTLVRGMKEAPIVRPRSRCFSTWTDTVLVLMLCLTRFSFCVDGRKSPWLNISCSNTSRRREGSER